MQKLLALLTAAALALLLTSCGTELTPTPGASTTPTPIPPTAPPEPKRELSLSAEDLSALRESIDGSTATIPLTEALYKTFSVNVPPTHNTTADAYSNLLYNNTELIFVTRPSENELKMAADADIELEVIPVVKDALVFLVNTDNPVENITLSQLRDIYQGKITNWSALGGSDERIIPYQRTVNSGSQTLLLELVMDGVEPMNPPTDWIAMGMGALVEAVSDYDNARDALGYSVFYYVNNMYGNSRFKLLSLDGVKPSRDTIARGEYALEDYYYAVLRKDTPEESLSRKLVNWLLTEEGQSLAVEAGYIPLLPIESAASETDIDPVYLGETEHSSGTGGTVLKTGDEVTDMLNENMRKPLSDMFFDGFNYIAYINEEITRQLKRRVVFESWVSVSLEEYGSGRPFTGIPNDYPNFGLDSQGLLCIYFPGDNPFFKRTANWKESFEKAYVFSIPLYSDISPFGTERTISPFTYSYHYDRLLMPRVDLFTLYVEIPESPQIEARINEQLKSWTDGLPETQETVDTIKRYLKWYDNVLEQYFNTAGGGTIRLIPILGKWEDYYSISYIVGDFDDLLYPYFLLSTCCFDLRTGEAVRLEDKLPKDLDYSNAAFSVPIDLENWEMSSEFEGATHNLESRISEAWLWGDSVFLTFINPDGTTVVCEFNHGIN